MRMTLWYVAPTEFPTISEQGWFPYSVPVYSPHSDLGEFMDKTLKPLIEAGLYAMSGQGVSVTKEDHPDEKGKLTGGYWHFIPFQTEIAAPPEFNISFGSAQ